MPLLPNINDCPFGLDCNAIDTFIIELVGLPFAITVGIAVVTGLYAFIIAFFFKMCKIVTSDQKI